MILSGWCDILRRPAGLRKQVQSEHYQVQCSFTVVRFLQILKYMKAKGAAQVGAGAWRQFLVRQYSELVELLGRAME